MNDTITLYDENNQTKEYKLLLIIDNDFKYIIYTDLDSNDLKDNLYAIKVKSLNNNEEIIPITDSEWIMIKEEYNKIVNNKKQL